jgi:hypothetical protein
MGHLDLNWLLHSKLRGSNSDSYTTTLLSFDRRFRWRSAILGAILAVCQLKTAGIAVASPITLAFDSQITDVRYNSTFDLTLPFPLRIDDTIEGQFTFDPSKVKMDLYSTAVEPFNLQFDIGGKIAKSSQYEFGFSDNVLFSVSAEDSFFELDSNSFGPFDIVDLGCGSLTLCAPTFNDLPGGDAFRLKVEMQLIRDQSILPLFGVDLDPAVWNTFQLQRLMRLTFDDSLGSTAILRCTVGAFHAIPEPSTIVLLAIFLPFVFFGKGVDRAISS